MAFDQRSLDDYVDVAERITEFYDKYPDGSLSAGPDCWRIVQAEGWRKDGTQTMQTFICYRAEAYRHPADLRPGVGVAWEIFPGRTPYTLGSELMNAETSAWGRALAALGIATKRGIASRQEVQGARERADGLPVNRDGSLSRSRTTDEEKAAAGVMTTAQMAEHTALRKGAHGPLDAAGKASKARAEDVDADGFYDPPRGPGGDPLPEEQPGSISRLQRTGIMRHLGALGHDGRAAKLSSLLGGKVITSTNDLSWREAELVLAELDKEAGK
jgi:hypothetical protein